MTDRLLRGALIGAGSIAPYHLTAWSRVPGVEIVAVYNRTRENAELLAERFGIERNRVYGDLDRMFACETELDFVDILSAPELHCLHVKHAAGHARHLLCQKPFAHTGEDAIAMIEAADRIGSTLTINENWRWRPWYRSLKRMLDDGEIGTVRYVRLSAHQNITLGAADQPPGLLQRQPYTATMPRLIVFEWGIHLIDTLRMLFGEAQWVHAAMDRASPLVAGEDRALMTFGFGGVIATIDISWASHVSEGLPTLLEDVTVEGDQGTIALVQNQGDGDLIRLVKSLSPDRLPIDRARPWSPVAVTAAPAHDGDIAGTYQRSFDAAHAHFAECWRADRSPETEAKDNLRTLMTTLAAYRSAELNQVVRIDQEEICE